MLEDPARPRSAQQHSAACDAQGQGLFGPHRTSLGWAGVDPESTVAATLLGRTNCGQ